MAVKCEFVVVGCGLHLHMWQNRRVVVTKRVLLDCGQQFGQNLLSGQETNFAPVRPNQRLL